MKQRLKRSLFVLDFALAAWFAYRALHSEHRLLFGVIAGLLILSGILWGAGRLGKRGGLTAQLGLTALIFDLILRNLPFDQLALAFRQADYFWLIPASLCIWTSIGFRALRWRWMLRSLQPVAMTDLAGSISIGFATNFIIPGRVGEVIRAVMLRLRTGIPVTTGFATVALERLMDSVMIWGGLVLGASVIGIREEKTWLLIFAAGGALGGVITFFLLFLWRREWFLAQVARRLPESLSGKVMGVLETIVAGLSCIRDKRTLAKVLLGGLLVWIPAIGSFWCCVMAFDWGYSFPWATPFVVLGLVAFSLAVPVTPAGLGVFQWVSMWSLKLVAELDGVTLAENQLTAFGFYVQLSQIIPFLTAGLLFYFVFGVSAAALKRESEALETEDVQAPA